MLLNSYVLNFLGLVWYLNIFIPHLGLKIQDYCNQDFMIKFITPIEARTSSTRNFELV